MAHDRSGAEIQVGDLVSLPLVVVQVLPGESGANLVLEVADPPPGEDQVQVECNGGMVFLAGPSAEISDPS